MGFWIPLWVGKIVAKRVLTYVVFGVLFGGGYVVGKRKRKDSK